ncbi:MAG: acyltransferase [Opitutaceae bacterium]
MSPPRLTDFQRRGHFDALDGLRAISILLVLFHHVPPVAPGLWSTLQENGRYGVAVFFAISGFLICTLLLREEREHGRIALGKFFGRRALRLLPLYYVALALQALFVFALGAYSPENQELFRAKLPSYFFYFSNWLPTATQGPFFCAWSLAVEEQFYLGFGFLMCFVRPLAIAALAVALVSKFVVYQTFGPVDAHSTAWRVIFSYQEAILWGVLVAFALDRTARHGVIARALRSGGLLAAVALAGAGWMFFHPMETQSTWDAQLLYLLVASLLAGLVLRPSTAVLGHRVFTHVGRISYGIYLLHMFVISAVKKMPGGRDPFVCFLVSTVIVIAIATVVHRFFEQPIIRWGKRWLAPGSAPRGKTSPSTRQSLPGSVPVKG